MSNKIETIDCRITNKMIPFKVSFDGPLTWREIVRTQSEKEEVLRNWFNETGCWPQANSTPVFDIDKQIVYPGYSLDYPTNEDENGNVVGISAYNHIRKAVIKKVPVNWNPKEVCYNPQYSNDCKGYYDAAVRFNGHYFIGASDVDPMILVAALQKFKKEKEAEKENEERNKELVDTLKKLNELLRE